MRSEAVLGALERRNMTDPAGVRRSHYIVFCCGCGKEFVHPHKQIKGPPEAADTKTVNILSAELDRAGWIYKKGFRRARCADCQECEPIEKMEQQTMTTKNAKVVDMPRELTRDQRRRIADHLETVIDQAKSCYRASGSDASCAEQLKVPRAWVKEVREQLFCDEDKNELSSEANEKLDALLVRVSDLATLFNDETRSIRKEIELLRKKVT